MLVLKRKDGQWLEIKHRSGDVLRVRVYQVTDHAANLAFDDDARNFDIQRPERPRRPSEDCPCPPPTSPA